MEEKLVLREKIKENILLQDNKKCKRSLRIQSLPVYETSTWVRNTQYVVKELWEGQTYF